MSNNVDQIIQNSNSATMNSLQPSEPSNLNLYTIPANTTLFHGTKTVSTFDPKKVNVGDESFVAFFSPNKEFAVSYIGNCARFPTEEGYVHEFVVKSDINNVYILSSHDKDVVRDSVSANKLYCNAPQDRSGIKLNGVGFFVGNTQTGATESEFAICNPGAYLEYVGTYRCIGPHQLSTQRDNFTSISEL